MDLVEQYGELALPLDFYLQAQGLGHLAEAMEGSFPPRFQRMTQELCEVGCWELPAGRMHAPLPPQLLCRRSLPAGAALRLTWAALVPT